MFPNRQKLNIDGEWILVPDPDLIGEETNWFQNPPIDKGTRVNIPLIEPLDPSISTSALWFIKEFEVQDSWDNSQVFLILQNINFKATIWLNGNFVGKHEGAFTSFQFHIKKHIRQGSNLITIQVLPISVVEDLNSTYIYDCSWTQYPGIWNSVYLEVVPKSHIQGVYVKPDIRGKRIVANVHVNSKGGIVKATIPDLGVALESNRPKLVIKLSDFETWTLNSPKLYDLHIEYLSEGQSDYTKIRFGMRDFSARENHFIFNFKPFVTKAVYFNWHIQDLNSPIFSENKLRDVFSKVREANFNLILTYGKPAPEKLLQICDELGLMIAETPSFRYGTEPRRYKNLVEQEISEFIKSHINNPSLAWLQFEYLPDDLNITDFVREIRKIDRSRLITVHHASFIKHPSYYCIPYNIDLLPTQHLRIKPQIPINDTTQFFLEHAGDEKSLNFAVKSDFKETQINQEEVKIEDKKEKYLSKIKEGFMERNLNLSLNSVESFLEQIKSICISNLQSHVDFLRRNPNIAGYCLHSILSEKFLQSDDILQNSENIIRQMKQMNNDLRVIVYLEKTNLTQNEEAMIVVSLVSHEKENINDESDNSEIKVSFSLHISSPTQQMLWKKKKEIKIKKDTVVLWKGDISGSSSIGEHILVARLSLNNSIVSETMQNFYVVSQPEKTDISVEFIEPQNKFAQICSTWTGKHVSYPPIYIVPPIYNSVFAYPESEFMSMLEQVRHGAVGILFSPPNDWNRLKEIITNCPQFTVIDLNFPIEMEHFHYVKPHPVFLNLPNRCLMKQPYKNIIPSKTFLQKGDEDICGCLVIPHSEDMQPFWGTDILVHRYGVGKLVFTNLRILENIPEDSIAVHLFTNMITYFARRAEPSRMTLPIPQQVVEWIRKQKSKESRKWIVIGEFPIVDETNDEQYYPTEKSIDLTTVYPGKYGEISWKMWCTNVENNHLLDFHEALSSPLHPHHLEQDNGVAFAFAEFNYEYSEEVIIQIKTANRFKLWFNGIETFENQDFSPKVQIFEMKVMLRKWKNTVFIKSIKDSGPHSFVIQFYDLNRSKIELNW
ncbi:MAG TPA: beta galactosidase jelly roll domain-containing protein [Candidatus Hydrogenedens sp.]|nr:beta galactosidase jelly roll domain-containing protein [Candidatus Hydrogenedens sp.]